jgi:hypothetical protein
MYSYNFISKNILKGDLDLFFGPVEIGEEFTVLEPNWIMAHVMYEAGVFTSISQARKNGWNKDIPKGYSHYVVGKKRYQVTILNV